MSSSGVREGQLARSRKQTSLLLLWAGEEGHDLERGGKGEVQRVAAKAPPGAAEGKGEAEAGSVMPPGGKDRREDNNCTTSLA